VLTPKLDDKLYILAHCQIDDFNMLIGHQIENFDKGWRG
jgi:hypothetical protein